MARTADTPAMQQAKGHAGKRGTKAEAERAEKLNRLLEMLAPVAGAIEVPPPAYLLEPGYEVALAVWKRKAPELRRTHRLPVETHDEFALYCVYYAEWLTLDMDIKARGTSQKIKNVSGSSREVDRPAVRHRQTAYNNLKDMWPKFGLTAVDMYSIFKDQASAAQRNPGLFDMIPARGASTATEDDAQPDAQPEAQTMAATNSPIGSASRYKSSPPKHMN